MDNREFVALVKKESVDRVVKQIVDTLEKPPALVPAKANDNPIGRATRDFINQARIKQVQKSEWFKSLPEDRQKMLQQLVEETAELAISSLFTLIDGIASYEGNFEIVAVNAKGRKRVLNPEDSEMLHDLFSEVCEESRQK